MAQLEKAKSSKKEPSSKQVFKAIFDDKALSLSEANEIDVTDARKVNTISGGNKVHVHHDVRHVVFSFFSTLFFLLYKRL